MLIDTLIHARWIIPIEPALIYEDHSLVIQSDSIIDLLPTVEAKQKYQARHVEELAHHALLPGFVNCHTHAAMSLMRGIADDLPLMTWLQEYIWPLEQKWMSPNFVKDGTELAIAEMILSGTTCFNDMYFFPELAAQQAIRCGIRANIGLVVIDFPTTYAQDCDDYLAKGLLAREQILTQSLVSLSLSPHAPYTVSDVSLHKIKKLADELQLPINMHVHETVYEVDSAKQQQGKRPLQRLQELGFIHSSFSAVHMTQLTSEEIAQFAQANAHIVHCPESNLKLASGFCPIAACLSAGINVALGTDGAASNNDLDMLGEMRTAALLAKAVAQDAKAVPAMTALQMATLNGAKALGLDEKIGSLRLGKQADVIAINLDSLATQPVYNPISQIVYAASREQITDVWVAGQRLLKNRQLTTIDSVDLTSRIKIWQNRLAN